MLLGRPQFRAGGRGRGGAFRGHVAYEKRQNESGQEHGHGSQVWPGFESWSPPSQLGYMDESPNLPLPRFCT